MHGLPICLNTFLYLHTISHFRYENLGDHFEQVGLCLRTHGNSKRLPANSFPAEETSHLAMFIKNYARAHGLPLPGRVPGHRDKVVILPSDITKTVVYAKYKEACTANWYETVWQK